MKDIGQTQQPQTQIGSDSHGERLRLMLLLVHFEDNCVRDKVFESANIYRRGIEKDAVIRDQDLAIRLRANRLK